MIDPLAERFLALAEDDAHGDWLDVRRRARRRKPVVLIVVLAAALLVAAAFAATNGWRFGVEYGHATAERTLVIDGHRFTLLVQQTGGDGRFFVMHLYPGEGRDDELRQAITWGGTLLHTPGLPDNPLIPRQLPNGPAMFGMNWRVAHGELWFGDARPEVVRIVVTDTAGRAFRADTVTPPKGVKSAFRYWTLVLPSSYGKWIAAYVGDGKLIERRLLFPARRQNLR